MKVALLSFHNAYNYGAALQAYGLQCAVQQLGVDCEYINYQNKFRKSAYDMRYQLAQATQRKDVVRAAKVLVGTPLMKKRSERFDAFYAKHLRTTRRVYETSEEARATNDVYDKFIVGSDQVWNHHHNGGDTAFLLDFVDDDQKKISYSSSFGVSALSPELEDVYGTYLRRFHRLATRESVGAEIIAHVAGRQAHLVLDPVFLAGKDKWDELRDATATQRKRYIFFYTNRQSQLTDFLNTGYASDEDFHVLSTQITPREVASRRIKPCISMSPGEFLEEIAAADLVVTASFHCLAMAIIYHKPFVVLLTGDHGKDERITSLLRIAGLEHRILTSDMTKADVLAPIDYQLVDSRIAKQLEYSREYLRRAIFDEEDVPFDTSYQNKYFCQDSRCVGCGACESACPTKAITMEPNEEGFLFPTLAESKCIHCYKCHSVCQVYTDNVPVAEQHYFGVKNTDEIRRVSSSGGMFRAMAQHVFNRGGVVFAAGMDEQFHVRHMSATNETELAPMCGTYYVQSVIGDTYTQVRERLNEGKLVLFVGTACQVQGLNDYLGKKPENLITCDIVCHGAPSPLVFERFIEFLKSKGELSEFQFRDKSLGWKGYHVSAVIDGKKITEKLWLQSFNNLFSHNMINRISCGSCPYTNYERPGDLTIGDFWGLEKSHNEFRDSLGVSLVMTNTSAGLEFFQHLALAETIEVSQEETLQNSLMKPAAISAKRLQAFQLLNTKGYAYLAKEFAEDNATGFFKQIIRKRLTRV